MKNFFPNGLDVEMVFLSPFLDIEIHMCKTNVWISGILFGTCTSTTKPSTAVYLPRVFPSLPFPSPLSLSEWVLQVTTAFENACNFHLNNLQSSYCLKHGRTKGYKLKNTGLCWHSLPDKAVILQCLIFPLSGKKLLILWEIKTKSFTENLNLNYV